MAASASADARMPARCWSKRPGLAKAPGPLRAFFLRIRARRGHQIVAVAVARKLAVLCWHLLANSADYQWARPALVASKLRSMEWQAGQTGPERKQTRRRLWLQHQGAARPGNRARPPCRTSLRAVREPMAAAWQLSSAHRCRKRGARLKAARPGLHPRSRLFAARSPVPFEHSRSRRRGLSISSVDFMCL